MKMSIASLLFFAASLALGNEQPRTVPPETKPRNENTSLAASGAGHEQAMAAADSVALKGRTAFVSVPKALIYSGPSEEYYPTAQLQQGSAVEVFHQTESGWAAIRPPKGSFSWIPASEVFLLPGGKTAEVSTNNSVSWIGTSLGTANQYRWQVRLNKGEQLIVISEETIKDSDGRESLWYKISPPSGEFRWIQSGVIASDPPATIAKQQEKPTASKEPQSEAEGDGVQPAGYDGIVLHGSAGEILDSEVIQDGEIIADGEVIMDGEIIDGGVYYEDPNFDGEYYGEPDTVVEPDASWDDWQLFEFTDEGLRFPLWERSLKRRAHLHDPLQHDPFSLAMAPKAKRSRLPLVTHEEPPAHIRRRRTPWRDPRLLAQQRLQGYPQANPERGRGTTLSAIRDSFNSSGSGNSNDVTRPNDFDTPRSAPDYFRDPHQPRLAPTLEQGAGAPTSGIGIAQGLPEGSNWLARNWNGLQQQFVDSGTGILNAGSTVLMQLQNRLNEIVTQPMIQWNFGSIKDQVRQLIHGGQSPAERGQARLLLERIEAFEQLAARSGYPLASYQDESTKNFGQLGPVVSSIPAPPLISTASYARPLADDFSIRPSAVTSGSATGAVRTNSLESSAQSVAGTIPFEATGWLVPVFAASAGQPTHAITDDNGRIVAYVTGLPGMNLDRYINQAVGIHGLRGYLPQLQAAHVEAQNIVRIR